VYVGGILVLTIFAVMLTHRIADVNVSNRAVGRPLAVLLVGADRLVDDQGRTAATWVVKESGSPEPTTYGIGTAFLTDYVLPYEIASLVLLVALIGRGGGVAEGDPGLMEGVSVNHFVVLSILLFAPGLFCVITRRNALGILMGIELILNSANINYVAFARYGGSGTTARSSRSSSSCSRRPRPRSGSRSCSGSTRRSRRSTSTPTDRLRG
jgi:hypothetical protein